jgi:hypothetical protein
MPYSASKVWTLTAVAGSRTVYAEYRTPPGNALALSGSIVLVPSFTVTRPTATSRWRSHSTHWVTWTMNAAVSTGEFRVSLVSRSGTAYVNKRVLPVAGKRSYSTSIAVKVPAGSGYRARVRWRSVVGSGPWTVTARSARFTVTP